MRRNCLQLSLRFLAAAGVVLLVGGAAPSAQAASAGLVVVIANHYDEFLPGAPRDANAIADKLEGSGFDAVRLINESGGGVAARIDQLRKAAEGAGPVRMVYASGFGICLNDDLVLFTEDVQPDQFKSGQVGDVVVPMSVVAEAIAPGGQQTLIVFDTTPNQCTEATLKAIKLPESTALLVTTGIGGDVVNEVAEDGNSAFTTAFIEEFASGSPLKDVIANVVARVPGLSEGEQQPILVGDLK